MEPHYCRNESRRKLLRDQTLLNGIDYIEVSPDRRSITVHFIHPLPDKEVEGVPSGLRSLSETNLIIEGGIRIRNLKIIPPIEIRERKLILNIDSPGDFSTYKLRLIKSPQDPRPIDGFDPRCSEVDFSFDVQYPLEVDCRRESLRWPEKIEGPQIDYMAKDYASFRQLILDRLAETIPEWKGKNPSDLGIALVELMAYVGDYLSYYQDAVATEAYLSTSRRRTSVRRHVMLLDYRLHDGCNSRCWVCFEVESGAISLRRGEKLLTWCNSEIVLDPLSWRSDIAGHRPEIFELLHDVSLYPEQNMISFYTWGEENFCIPKGASKATLIDTSRSWVSINAIKGENEVRLSKSDAGGSTGFRPGQAVEIIDHDLESAGGYIRAEVKSVKEDKEGYNLILANSMYDTGVQAKIAEQSTPLLSKLKNNQRIRPGEGSGWRLNLKNGDVLIIEETVGPKTGDGGDADPSHRHPVRLKEVIESKDPITGQAVLEVEWHSRDALPFALQVSARINGILYSDMSCARGNVALADHGATISDQMMLPPEVPEGEYRPRLWHRNLTFSAPYYHSSEIDQPASHATLQEPYMAQPALHLKGDDELWTAEGDLLKSDRFSSHFVVETEDDTSVYLRFGDGIQGRRPTPGSIMNASYRIGNGASGNVGAESIAHLVMAKERGKVSRVRNPLPAQGGTDPEPTYQAKFYAPYIFRRPHRAVIEGDYAEMAERYQDVDKAVAFIGWTGSWHTMYVIVSRKDRKPVDDDFKKRLRSYLDEFRQAGCDIEIRPPRFKPLVIVFTIGVKLGYQTGNVKQELLKVFSSSDTADGRRGFFHPANFGFGQPVYLCDIISAAMEVPGVAFVDVGSREPHRFCPLAGASYQATCEMIDRGMIAPDRLEILQLDNDPNIPENGTISFIMQGGS